MWLRIIKRHAKSLPENCIGSRTHTLLKNIAPKVAQLRHTAVHRLHLTPKELLCQLHSACVLAEILQDVGTASRLQTVYIEVDTHAKKMVHTIEIMQQEVNSTPFQMKREREALVQREQQLLSYVAQQRIDIPTAADEALVESVNALLATHRLDKSAERQSMISSNQNIVYAEHAIIFEDDIESDEEQLEAELRQS
ncbi:hypothetical protein BS50DRAFT_287940 [Corynespora cassiicola Philippines]|uniref:Uncharacterized protein n=1 Tax=Corynespora cassiicola Philippines TaxID=1448308 RepID=A0A2T2N1Y3_CORCC|nr:hypothetical protein BS50DRAFT_287940 [Corynespora cassiicola Philippines]